LDNWNTVPFAPQVIDGVLYGRGAADMKGEIATMNVALKHFLNDYPNFGGSVAYLLTSTEEGHGELGTPLVLQYLAEQNIKMDYCLVGEATANAQVGDSIRVGRRGSLHANIEFNGVQGHVAYPHLVTNAIHKSLEPLATMVNTTWDNGNEVFPPTSMQIVNYQAGYGADNVAPGEAKAHINFRYNPASPAKSIEERVESILKEHNVEYNINWRLSGLPYYTEPGDFTSKVASAIKSVTNLDTVPSTAGGTSDGRFIAQHCPQVIELGVVNESIHQANEHVKVADLVTLCKIYYKLLQQVFEVSQPESTIKV
ncbi:MAG: succinyl-diaminopimelate desuccinylase, partial [Pseudomonadota bacterium]